MSTVGSAMGYTNNVTKIPPDRNDMNFLMPMGDTITPTGGEATKTKADIRTYSIPLSSISSLFRSYDKLLPSHLMSGMRFEIELESARVAFQSIQTGTTGTSSINVTVSDVELHMDAYTLTDSVTRVLNESAATSGLEIPFVTYGKFCFSFFYCVVLFFSCFVCLLTTISVFVFS